MAKKSLSSKEKKKQLNKLFATYNKRLGRLYADYIRKLSALYDFSDKESLPSDPLFHFDDYPELKKRLNDIFADYYQNSILNYKAGITDGVALAYAHDAAALTGFSVLSNKALRAARETAAETFISRRLNSIKGLNLAQTVWNYCQQTKSEFEMAMANVLADGLKAGTSAETIGRKIRQYLNNPDMMYRRYHTIKVLKNGTKKDMVTWRRKRIIDGKVRFVEEPLEQVGAGVYRSSRMNALRVARTEINAAYHKARNERWKSEPFVIGQWIHVSPEHKIDDICNELEDRYPKDFDWSGWHSQCLCTSDPIMIQGEEKDEFYRRLYAGEDMSNFHSVFEVKDMPDKYKQYIKDNADKIVKAAKKDKLAWHLADNKKYWVNLLTDEQRAEAGISLRGEPKIKTPFDIAKERHAKRTPEQINDIKLEWRNRRFSQYLHTYDALLSQMPYYNVGTQMPALRKRWDAVVDAIKNDASVSDVRSLFNRCKAGIKIQGKWNQLLWNGFTEEQIENCRKIERLLGIRKGRPMTWEQANKGKENPFYWRNVEYRINCQTCTVVHELRRRGFNISAKANDLGYQILSKEGFDWCDRFFTILGKRAEQQWTDEWMMQKGYAKMSKARLATFLDEKLTNNGRYEIYCKWKDRQSAHVFCVEVKNGKRIWFDPQDGIDFSAKGYGFYLNSAELKTISVTRIDNALINPKMTRAINTTGQFEKGSSIAINGTSKSIDAPASLFTGINKASTAKEKTVLIRDYIAENEKNFQRIDRHSSKDGSIFSLYKDQYDVAFKQGEMPKNLDLAKKVSHNGYDMYLMSNPSDSKSFDFIAKDRKTGMLYALEGKTFNGENTLGHLIANGSKQSDRVLIDIIGNTNTKYVYKEAKAGFENNLALSELWLLKGGRLIKVNRALFLSNKSEKRFKKIWE